MRNEKGIWCGLGLFTFLVFSLSAHTSELRYEVLRDEARGGIIPLYEAKFFGRGQATRTGLWTALATRPAP